MHWTSKKEDIKLLKNTKVRNKHLKNKNSIPHFYPTLEQVTLHNKKNRKSKKHCYQTNMH